VILGSNVRVAIARPRSYFALYPVIVLLVFGAAYWTVVGRGFISDDFRWILESRVRSAADFRDLFVDTTGFYRPVVGIVFAATEQFSGSDPRLYGLVNLLFAVLCAVAIAALARSLRLPAGAALLAGSLWLLNPHGVNMAVMWMSGLTALCLVLFSVLAAVAVQRGWLLLALAFFLAAVLSKEEAVLLPVLLVAIAWTRDGGPSRRLWWFILGLVVVEAAYFFLRSSSDAMTPADAPSYYRFSFALSRVLENMLEYADRAVTFSAAVVLIVGAVVRARPALQPAERTAILIGLLWLVVGYAVTVFLPVRSSLYALLPSVGAVIAASAVVSALWRRAGFGQRRALRILAVVVPLALLPVLRMRTDRWTELASVSRTTLETIAPSISTAPVVLFVDDLSRRDNLKNAFGTLFADALELRFGVRPEVWLTPPPEGATSPLEPVPASVDLGWRYQGGRLEPIDPATWTGATAIRVR
jgi:hypothetical protein